MEPNLVSGVITLLLRQATSFWCHFFSIQVKLLWSQVIAVIIRSSFQARFAWKLSERQHGGHGLDGVSSHIVDQGECLTELFNSSKAYRTIDIHWSTLSSTAQYLDGIVDGVRVGCHGLVMVFIKEIFNIRTLKPKYSNLGNSKQCAIERASIKISERDT